MSSEKEKKKKNKDLEYIKKHYGEEIMKFCREHFSTILNQEGKLTDIFKSNIATNSRMLYNDIIDAGAEESFKEFIFSKSEEDEEPEIIENKTPYELCEKAGYDLFECTTEEEIQSYKKYFKRGEELCTFHGGRLDKCFVFFAVKKDVDNIKRKNFKFPQRDDEYGTSVMSIQFNKYGVCRVSIKNRYNHTVENPDATLGNNLDRIEQGLAQSFKDLLERRGVQLKEGDFSELPLHNYVIGPDKKYYKYNKEINGVYYCPGNIIIDHGKIIKLESEKKELIDYFIVDKQNKTISLYDPSLKDSFIDGFEDISDLEVRKDKETGNRIITIKTVGDEKPATIVVNKENDIIEYENENLTKIGDSFLICNTDLKKLNILNVETIGNDFLSDNELLESINLPEVKTIGNNFLKNNGFIESINLPKVKNIGDYFMNSNNIISEISFPEVEAIGSYFMTLNEALTEIKIPKVEIIGDYFFFYNDNVEVNLPKARIIGESFLGHNKTASKVNLPNVETIGNNFMSYNEELSELNIPKVKNIGKGFLLSNQSIERRERISYKFKALKNKIKGITARDIAEVDKDNQMTTSDIEGARNFFESTRNFFRGNDRQ